MPIPRFRLSTLIVLAIACWAGPVTATEAPWQVPRTAWDSPSLEGVWSNETLTPFERPLDQADKPFITSTEAAAAAARIRAAQASDAAPKTPSQAPAAPGGSVGAYNLAWLELGTGTVSTRRSSLVIDPPDGRVPVRPEALARRDSAAVAALDDFELMSPWDRCITRGMPGAMFPAGYNNYYRIVQRPEAVLIHYEMIHEARIIPLGDANRAADNTLRSWNGEPRGHWDGDTLVVESRGYRAGGWIATSASQRRIRGIAHTAKLHVVERFTRVSDDTILWQATINDPDVYTAPWTVEIPLVRRPGERILEYACHEGNQAVGNVLRGARVQQRRIGSLVRLDAALDELVPVDATVEKVAGGFEFTEGPVWQAGRLVFSDIPANTVYTWSEADGTQVILNEVLGADAVAGVAGGSNGLALDPSGALVLCEHGNRRITRLAPDGTRTTLAERYQGRRLNSPNDIVYHSSGAAFFTDPPYGLVGREASPLKEQPHNGVYRLDLDGTVTLLSAAQSRPNGIGLSPDEQTLYVANSDSAPNRLWMAYPVRDDLTLGTGRVFFDANTMPQPGVPDGLALDRQGNLYATGPGGVLIFNPAGHHLGTIELPEQPANVGWGDAGNTLYMTARTGLYRVRLNAQGLVYRASNGANSPQ